MKIAYGQNVNFQQGMVLKNGTTIRVGDVTLLNKRSHFIIKSALTGVFSIAASPGDTIEISSAGYESNTLIVSDFSDRIVYLQPAAQLQPVVIKAASIGGDLAETQQGYRRKSVFYTGTPHYYYLVLKPFTFVYENFKSEVKDARRFKKYAARELKSVEVAKRFTNSLIKQTVPVTNDEADEFKVAYEPTVEQIRKWNDYELITYIRKSYASFRAGR